MTKNKQLARTNSKSMNGWWAVSITAVLFFALGLIFGRYFIPVSLDPAPVAAASGITTDAETLAAIVREEVQMALNEAQPAALAQVQESQQQGAQPTPAAQPSGPQQPQAARNISEDDDPAWGPVDAKVVVVEFSDYQ